LFHSSSAALLFGAKTAIPAARKISAVPAQIGSSGPITTSPIALSRIYCIRAAVSRILRGASFGFASIIFAHSPSIPGFGGVSGFTGTV